MPDRIIRDELLESDRWLDLPSDTHRLVYENLLLIADDYGNFEGGPRRLWRWMHRFTQLKSETDSIKLMSDLQDADLVLRYEVGGKEYWHVRRFKNSRWYWKREVPISPHPEDVTNLEKQRPTEKRSTHDTDTSATRREGVGVGVGVGEVQKQVLGVSESPTRGPEVKPVFKKIPHSTPSDVERAREIARQLMNHKIGPEKK